MSDLARTYYGARKTCLEMFLARGYQVPDHHKNLTEKEFEIMFDKKQMEITGITDNQNKPVYVRLVEPSRTFNKVPDKQAIFKDIAKHFKSTGMTPMDNDKNVEEAADQGIIRLCLIYNAQQQGNAQNKLEQDYITHPYIEIHRVHVIYINPTESILQPKYELITDEIEIAKIYKRYDAKPLLIGSICIDDPINRYYRGRPAEKRLDKKGELVDTMAHLFKVIRKGSNIFYRKVTLKRMNIK